MIALDLEKEAQEWLEGRYGAYLATFYRDALVALLRSVAERARQEANQQRDEWWNKRGIEAVERARREALMEAASLAMESTGPGNTVEQAQGYSDACRDIGQACAIRALAEKEEK
jgi:hypothetical protein